AAMEVLTPIKKVAKNNINIKNTLKYVFRADFKSKIKDNTKIIDKHRNNPLVIGCANTPLIRPKTRPSFSAKAYASLNSPPLNGNTANKYGLVPGIVIRNMEYKTAILTERSSPRTNKKTADLSLLITFIIAKGNKRVLITSTLKAFSCIPIGTSL